MDHSNGSTDYSSEFESVKKVKHLIESDGDNIFKAGDRDRADRDRSEEVWIKPKSERKSVAVESAFCGRLTVTTQSGPHNSDGAASSSEMSPGASSPSRHCTQCGTTKTPLWRNGPCGPKSLCNACGIRYKKVGCTKQRPFNAGASEPNEAGASHAQQQQQQQQHHQPPQQHSAKSSAKSPKRKAEDALERSHSHNSRRNKVVVRDTNTSTSNKCSSSNNSSSSSKREAGGVEEKVAAMVFRRVTVPRRVCTRRSLPAFHHTPKWGSRSARFNSFRKSQSKDEEEEGAALLMALACGLVNA